MMSMRVSPCEKMITKGQDFHIIHIRPASQLQQHDLHGQLLHDVPASAPTCSGEDLTGADTKVCYADCA